MFQIFSLNDFLLFEIILKLSHINTTTTQQQQYINNTTSTQQQQQQLISLFHQPENLKNK